MTENQLNVFLFLFCQDILSQIFCDSINLDNVTGVVYVVFILSIYSSFLFTDYTLTVEVTINALPGKIQMHL